MLNLGATQIDTHSARARFIMQEQVKIVLSNFLKSLGLQGLQSNLELQVLGVLLHRYNWW
ncbi:hypothetical protein D3C75_1117120 [compost metagenome]